MEAANVLCIRPTARKAWIVVPTTNRGISSCVALSSTKSPWAIRALVGAKKDRDCADATLVLKAFEVDIRARHISSKSGTSNSSESGTPPKKKLNRLDDSDDEPEEEEVQDDAGDSQTSACSQPTTKKKSRVSVSKFGFGKVDLNGKTAMVGWNKGPGLQLQADAETVTTVFQHLNTQYDILLAAGRKVADGRLAARNHETCTLNRLAPSECRKRPSDVVNYDTNRIRFDFRNGAFTVHYQGDDNKAHRMSTDFVVPRTSTSTGNVLEGEAYIKAKEVVLAKARDAWNQHDKSGAERYTDI